MPNAAPCRIIWLKNTDSTSKRLRELFPIEEERLVVSADFQTAGRGQSDHVWHSADGQNLLFSLYLHYSDNDTVNAAREQLVTMAASLAVVDFLWKKGVKARIKKPNDIYVGGGKICGMLIENGICGKRLQWSIVGIGLNVNECKFPETLPNPVSLSMLTGRESDRKECLNSLLDCLFARIAEIWSHPDELEREYGEKTVSVG